MPRGSRHGCDPDGKWKIKNKSTANVEGSCGELWLGSSRRASTAGSSFLLDAARLRETPTLYLCFAIITMSSTADIASSFIEGAPPGELSDVVNDVKALTSDNDPALIPKLKPAFQKYNEEQLTAVKLPGSSQPVSAAQACWCSIVLTFVGTCQQL